jgi:hypothetical protein
MTSPTDKAWIHILSFLDEGGGKPKANLSITRRLFTNGMRGRKIMTMKVHRKW